jgi:hypothetical protein
MNTFWHIPTYVLIGNILFYVILTYSQYGPKDTEKLPQQRVTFES